MSDAAETAKPDLIDPIAPLRNALRSRYDIGREIGQGAYATVFLARDLKHERPVALKVLNVDPTSDTSEIRFIREIRTLARLQHPNILPLHDSGHVEALLYYVSPYVNGETVRSRIDREKQLSVDVTCSIGNEIADALDYAHSQGIVHRDIKPENILISGAHAVLADFGIAKAIDVAGVRQITATGMGSPGTPAYMSPEQLMGERHIDGRSDIYSLGCVLYEMLTGKPPFAGKEGFTKRFTEDPPSVKSLRPDLPVWLDRAIAGAMQRSPRDRFSNAREFIGALCPPERSGVSPSVAAAAPRWQIPNPDESEQR
jgi:serine/threonine protein kinase